MLQSTHIIYVMMSNEFVHTKKQKPHKNGNSQSEEMNKPFNMMCFHQIMMHYRQIGQNVALIRISIQQFLFGCGFKRTTTTKM